MLHRLGLLGLDEHGLDPDVLELVEEHRVSRWDSGSTTWSFLADSRSSKVSGVRSNVGLTRMRGVTKPMTTPVTCIVVIIVLGCGDGKRLPGGFERFRGGGCGGGRACVAVAAGTKHPSERREADRRKAPGR